jgi:Uma2 family endonuclease
MIGALAQEDSPMATALAPAEITYPPLESGDQMTAAEFERRYDADPRVHHAELIDGVVYVSSPVRAEYHGKQVSQANRWLGAYADLNEDIEVYVDSTLRIDERQQLQPDVALCVEEGTSRIDDEGYLIGAPELVVEVAASSVSRDLHRKKDIYAELGVREYIVWRVYDETIDWFVLEEGRYVQREADKNGLIVSAVFEGLRLDVPALLKGDMKAVIKAVSEKPPRKSPEKQ